MNTILAMAKRIIPSVATKGRIITMLLVAASGIAIGILLRRAGDVSESDLIQFVARFGFTIFVPLVALVISTASLGSLIEEKTLVYFWLRPIGRWKISLAALVAGFVVLLPLVLIPMGALGAVAGTNDAIIGALAGSAVGLVAYTSVFTMLGLFTQRALAWGLLYVLIWEGLVGNFSRASSRLAISTYANGTMGHVTDVTIVPDPPATATITMVTIGVAITCFLITTWRLSTMTVD